MSHTHHQTDHQRRQKYLRRLRLICWELAAVTMVLTMLVTETEYSGWGLLCAVLFFLCGQDAHLKLDRNGGKTHRKSRHHQQA